MATTSSSNFTSLYGANASPIVPSTPYGNANVVALLATSTDGSNTIGNISATGNVAADYFLGDGSQLTGIGSSYTDANVATFLAAFGSNTIVTTGNITGGYIFGNGSQLTGLPATYGNANVATLLAGFGSNSISTTGNVTATNFIGNGAGLTGITVTAGTQILNGTSNVSVALNGNTTVGVAGVTRGTFSSGGLTVDGNVRTSGLISATGDVLGELGSFGNVNSGGYVSAVGDVSTGGNIDATGFITAGSTISAAGNIIAGSGSFFIGNGSQLTGITAASTYGNANVTTLLAAFGSNVISTTGNITGSNINASTVQATGSGGLALKNSAGTTQASMGAGGGDNFAINVSTNLNGVNAQIDISPTGSGHVHIKPTGTGAIEIAPTSTGSINNMVIGNITPAAVSATTVSATGNITGSYFLGNGSALTGITATTANSATYLTASGNAAAYVSVNDTNKVVVLPGGGAVSYVGNGVDPLTFGSVDVVNPQANFANAYSALTFINAASPGSNPLSTINVSNTGALLGYDLFGSGKTLTVGSAGVETNTTISAAGNITAPYFLGNGSALTGIVATLPSTISVSGNITGGNLNTPGMVSATGNVTGANLVATTQVNVTGTNGNISGANYVNANYFTGNGSLLTGISATAITNGTSTIAIGSTNGNGNVSIAGTSNVVVFTTSGITTTGLNSSGIVSATGNITGGNVNTAGKVSATGNITGGNIVGVSSSVATGIINYKDYVYTITYASTITPDAANGSIQQVTLTGNMTLNAFGGTPQAGQSMVLKLIQDATGSRTLSSTMKWAGGNKTLSTAANAVDIASIFYDGSTYYASLTTAYA